MYFFIAQLHSLSYLSLFTKWHRKANVIFQQLCTETDGAKYNREIPWKHKQPKPHQKTSENRRGFYRRRSLWSHHKIFYCVSWQLAGGSHPCASESLYCMMKQTKDISALPLSSESRPWVQQCIIVLLFHTPGSWHLASRCCSASFSHTCTHIKDLQGSGSE